MTDEKTISTDGKKMEMYLEEWETYNNQVSDILDAIDRLSDYRHPFAISYLAADLVKAAEERQEALADLKRYGIRNHEDALFTVCKRKAAEKATA